MLGKFSDEKFNCGYFFFFFFFFKFKLAAESKFALYGHCCRIECIRLFSRFGAVHISVLHTILNSNVLNK